MSLNEYSIEYARTSRASCKNPKCRIKINPGELRIGKTVEGSTQWYHVHCMFETFTRVKPTTKVILTEKDFKSGWDHLKPDDKEMVRGEMAKLRAQQLKQTEDLAPGETQPDRVPVGSSLFADQALDRKRKPEEDEASTGTGEGRKSARLQARAVALGITPASSVAGPTAAGEHAEGRGSETLGGMTIALNQPKAVSVPGGLSAIDLLVQDHRKAESVYAEFTAESSDLSKKKSLLMELLRLVFVHDFIETRALYPAVKEALGAEDPLLAKALHVHTLIRAELNILGQSEISDPRTIETAQKMFTDLSSHMKEEETMIFPQLQKKLSESELSQLGGMLQTLKTQAPVTELFMQTEGISAVAALAAERALLGDMAPTPSSSSSSASSVPPSTLITDEGKTDVTTASSATRIPEQQQAASIGSAGAAGGAAGASAEA